MKTKKTTKNSFVASSRQQKKLKLSYCYTASDGTRMAVYENAEGFETRCPWYIFKRYHA